MVIEIRRWHVLIALCAGLLLARAVIFSKETRPTLQDEATMAKSASQPTFWMGGSVPQSGMEGNHGEVSGKSPGGKEADLAIVASPAPLKAKTLALTFDDGPHPGHTERLLKILRDSNVHATFFVVGKQVEKYPELLEMIVREGHEIGNHTYSHPDMRKLSPADMLAEMEKTERLVYPLTGKKMRYFRPPGGQYNPAVVAAAKTLGYEMVLWSVLPQDHTRPSASLIRARVLESSKSGGIVLLHSGVESTLDTLPGLIHTLKDRGFKFETVAQIARAP